MGLGPLGRHSLVGIIPHDDVQNREWRRDLPVVPSRNIQPTRFLSKPRFEMSSSVLPCLVLPISHDVLLITFAYGV